MIAVPGSSSRITLAACSPSVACAGGIRMSMIASSGRAERTWASSSTPLPAWPTTSNPERSSKLARPSRSRTSSSASTTRGARRSSTLRLSLTVPPRPDYRSRAPVCGRLRTHHVPAAETGQIQVKPVKQLGEFRLFSPQQRAYVFSVFLRPVGDSHESASFRLPVVPDLPCCLPLTIPHRRGTVLTAGARTRYLLAVMRGRQRASRDDGGWRRCHDTAVSEPEGALRGLASVSGPRRA